MRFFNVWAEDGSRVDMLYRMLQENTAKYIEFVLVRLTTIGTIYLTFVALLPEFLLSRTSIPFYLGGTALLIVVVVMIDFITQVQSHLFQHQYEGLLKKTKLKGRR